MNTTIHLSVVCTDREEYRARTVLEEAHQHLISLEENLSEFKSLSPVYQLNRAPGGQKVSVNRAFLDVWTISSHVSSVSSNAFNSLAKSKSLRPSLEVDFEKGLAWRSDELTHVGFGAIGKGYSLDRVRELLEKEGFSNFCLNAGGSSIILSGFRGDTPWSFSWSWQEGFGKTFNHTSGQPIALGISGLTTQRDHLIDPHLKQSTTRSLSTLVGHPSAAMADALSTAVFVKGFEASLKPLGRLLDSPAIAVIEPDETSRWNGTFQNWWGALALLMIAVRSGADETVDLSDLSDVSNFTPYITQQNFAWVLLPALTLLLVFWHLKTKPQEDP